eukprot:11284864-Heterocapsa_arctica.AAC.1
MKAVEGEIYIFTSDTGNFNILPLALPKKMKDLQAVTVKSVAGEIYTFTFVVRAAYGRPTDGDLIV